MMDGGPGQLPAPDLIGDRYTLVRELGRGGMAVVYLARDHKHERDVAVKVMLASVVSVLGAQRFLREIAIAAQLQHPNLVGLIDSGVTNEAVPCPFYVMPFIEGESLRQRIEREPGPMPVSDALRILREVGDALHYAHSRGVVHRDIKPENILIAHGHAQLADFGIALAMGNTTSERLTGTGLSVGTPCYMSPEQVGDVEAVGPASDQYSLACVLYEILAGRPPFTGNNPGQVMARHVLEPPPPLRSVRAEVPAHIAMALDRALAKLPTERFEDVASFLQALEPGPGSAELMSIAVTEPGRSVPVAPAFARSQVALIAVLRDTAVRYRRVGLSILSVLVVAGGALTARMWFMRDGSDITRLVVLPFRNLGPAGDTYFADGLSEELSNRLAGLSGLGVIARTSALQYRDQASSVRQIRSELEVEYLIEGTVTWQRPGAGPDTVRVSASLVRTRNGTKLWSDSYDVALADVFALQSRMVEAITGALGVMPVEAERQRLVAEPTRNMEAYDAFLRGNAAYDRSWARTDVESAVSMYERAVELDPDFALAQARLGQAHAWMNQLRYDLTEDRLVAAKRAVDRAMALDPRLPEAHIAMGVYWYWGRQNYDRAMQEFEAADSLRPRDAQVALLSGHIRRRQGRVDDAITRYRRSAQSDPKSYRPWFNLGETLLLTRRYREAVAPLERSIALAPDFLEAYVQRARLAINSRGDLAEARDILRRAEERIPPTAWRATMLDFARVVYHPDLSSFLERVRPGAYGLDSATYHVMKGSMLTQLDSATKARIQYDSARAHLERLRDEQPDQAWIHGLLGVAYAGIGRAADAIRSAERASELLPVSSDALDGPEWLVNLGRVHMQLGREDLAVQFYDSALSIPSWISIESLRVDPLLAPLRRHRAFQALVNRWGRDLALGPDSGGIGKARPGP